MSIVRNIAYIIEKHIDYFWVAPMLSYIALFVFMLVLGYFSIFGLIDVSILEKITPDIFMIPVVPKLYVFSYLFGLVIFYGLFVVIYYQIFSIYMFWLRIYLGMDLRHTEKIPKLIKVSFNFKTILSFFGCQFMMFYTIYALYFDDKPMDNMRHLIGAVFGLILLPFVLMFATGMLIYVVMYFRGYD